MNQTDSSRTSPRRRDRLLLRWRSKVCSESGAADVATVLMWIFVAAVIIAAVLAFFWQQVCPSVTGSVCKLLGAGCNATCQH
jgi:hypothetical protein